MTKRIILSIILAAAIVGVILLLTYMLHFPGTTQTYVQTTGNSVAPQPSPQPAPSPQPGVTIIIYTDSGFSPNPVNIKSGDTATFVNQSSNTFWPATDPHPIHSGYPETGTCERSNNAFDPCAGITPGGSWSFTFKHHGTWGYHDHLNPVMSGKIIVQ